MNVASLGCVIIGRNEGERLVACLRSLVQTAPLCVYVDSGSTDGSVANAKALGVHVVELNMTVPFTAARARNEGWRALSELNPDLTFVQFVDGDCIVAEGWLEKGLDFLQQNTGYAVVCGRRREKYPQRSIYNQMCDWEWDTPIGEVKACGGDALMRVTALQQVGGYRDDLIAGEEPEMCVRLRQAGWRVYRLDAEMTLHDANLLHFGQWWTRTVRGGHAFAEGAWLHGGAPEYHKLKETLRSIFWGASYPVVSCLLAIFLHPSWALMLFAYPVQMARFSRRRGGWPVAFFAVIGKFAELLGVLKFYNRLLIGGRRKLIEYK